MSFDPLYLFEEDDESPNFHEKRKLSADKDPKFIISEYCIKFVQWSRINLSVSRRLAEDQLQKLMTLCSELFRVPQPFTINDLPSFIAALEPLIDSSLFQNVILELRIQMLVHLMEFSTHNNNSTSWIKQYVNCFGEWAICEESIDKEKLAKHPNIKGWLDCEKLRVAQDIRFLYVLYRVEGDTEDFASKFLRLSPLRATDAVVEDQLAIISRVWKMNLSEAQIRELMELWTSFNVRLARFVEVSRYFLCGYKHLAPQSFPDYHFPGVGCRFTSDKQQQILNVDKEKSINKTTSGVGIVEQEFTGEQVSSFPSMWTSVRAEQTSVITPESPSRTTTQTSDLVSTLSPLMVESKGLSIDLPLPLEEITVCPENGLLGFFREETYDKVPASPVLLGEQIQWPEFATPTYLSEEKSSQELWTSPLKSMRVEELAPQPEFTSFEESVKIVYQENIKTKFSLPNENSSESGKVTCRTPYESQRKVDSYGNLSEHETLEVLNELCETNNDEGLHLKTARDTPESNEQNTYQEISNSLIRIESRENAQTEFEGDSMFSLSPNEVYTYDHTGYSYESLDSPTDIMM